MSSERHILRVDLLSRELKDRVEKIARAKDRPASWVGREAIRMYVESVEEIESEIAADFPRKP